MDALESQLLIQKTKVKSPGFAAILSFFFPAFGAFYVGKVLVGFLYLVIDFFNLLLAIVGVGILTGLLFRLIAAFLAYSWAQATNTNALEALIASRKQQSST